MTAQASISAPQGVDVYNGDVWVVDQAGYVREFDTSLELQKSYSLRGDHPVQAIAHDQGGYMITTRQYGFFVLDPNGNVVQEYADPGTSGNGQMLQPYSVGCYGTEAFFALPNGNRISIFNLK